jgi:hypothetical protein
LNEWELQDSAGYTLPFDPNQLQLSRVIKSTASLNFIRLHGYVQDNIVLNDSLNMTLQVGVRYNFNTLNNELLLQPRIQFAIKAAMEKGYSVSCCCRRLSSTAVLQGTAQLQRRSEYGD